MICPKCGVDTATDECSGCGVIISKYMKKNENITDAPAKKECHLCGETILAVAKKCKHCGSMIDGSHQASSGVVVKGIDPFAEYHTEIQGKKEGKITFVGYLGIFLGILMLMASCSSISNGKEAEGGFMFGLMGLGFIIGSFLWARRK